MLKLLRKELFGRNFFVGGRNPSSRKNIENLSRIKKQKMSLEQKMKKREGIVSLTRLIENKKMPSRNSLEL